MNIACKLKALLEEKNMTQYQLKKKANVSSSVISDLVNGKNKNPTIDLLRKIACALDISVSDLIGENEEIFSEENIIDNIKLVMGDMTPEEFAAYINSPGITGEMLEFYLSGDLKPQIGSIYIISEALKIDYNFFYRVNDRNSLKIAQDHYNANRNNIVTHTICVDDDELNLLQKLRDNKIDVKTLNSLIEILVLQKDRK